MNALRISPCELIRSGARCDRLNGEFRVSRPGDELLQNTTSVDRHSSSTMTVVHIGESKARVAETIVAECFSSVIQVRV
jgi:hypothetical protein